MSFVPALAALALAAASPAQLSAPAPSSSIADHVPSSRLKLFGLQLDGGVPDGGVVSLLVRPVKWVRADAGFAYNYFSMGARGGLTLVPFHWAVVPTLRVEGGRFFRSDVTSKAERFASDLPTYMKPALEGFGYDYASAQLGLEFGSQKSFVFFVRGGLAWVKADFGDGRALRDDSSPNTEIDVSGLSASASGPTASLGFLFYVW
jgi:hypothetical protein